MTQLTPDQMIERGEAAERVLRDPIFQEAWAAVRDDYINSIVTSPHYAIDDRERAKVCLDIMENVAGKLAHYMKHGEFERQKKGLFRFSKPSS